MFFGCVARIGIGLAAQRRLIRSFAYILVDFCAQKWFGWVRTTLRIHLDEVSAQTVDAGARFDDLGLNQHCGPDLDLKDKAGDSPLEWVRPILKAPERCWHASVMMFVKSLLWHDARHQSSRQKWSGWGRTILRIHLHQVSGQTVDSRPISHQI